MNRNTHPFVMTVVSLLALGGAVANAAAPADAKALPATAVLQLDWKTLLPLKERQIYEQPVPPAVHDYLGEGDMAALQTGSFEANRDLDGKRVKIPGFVVPLERAANGQISEFLLVPYFGACIHLPPPPPNQVVYVRMRNGTSLKEFDDAVWVTGTLRTALRKSDLGSAVYTLDGVKIEPYQYSRP
jgi:hypothetical protein